MKRNREKAKEHQRYPLLRDYLPTGGYLAIFQAATVIFAVVGYFIWPHVFTGAEAIFVGIQEQPAAYFMKLDPFVLFGTILQLPVWLALWVALNKRHPAESMLGLAAGSLSTVAVLPTRPLIELYSLSSLHPSAETVAQKNLFVSAGEALLVQIHGTAWAVSIMSGGLASLFFGRAMLRSTEFHRRTGILFIVAGLGALFVLVPVVGIALLFLLATIGGILASLSVGMDLIRFGSGGRG